MERKALNRMDKICFPRTRWHAIINAGSCAAGAGQGHNGAQNGTLTVVGTVVGFFTTKSNAYLYPQRYNGQKCPPIRVRVRACAHTGHPLFYRCTVVPNSYPIEKERKNREKGHNAGHNTLKIWPKTVVATVVGYPSVSLNPLKNNKKGGFAHG